MTRSSLYKDRPSRAATANDPEDHCPCHRLEVGDLGDLTVEGGWLLLGELRESFEFSPPSEYISYPLSLTSDFIRIASQQDWLLKLLVPGQGLLLLGSPLRGVKPRVVHILQRCICQHGSGERSVNGGPRLFLEQTPTDC